MSGHKIENTRTQLAPAQVLRVIGRRSFSGRCNCGATVGRKRELVTASLTPSAHRDKLQTGAPHRAFSVCGSCTQITTFTHPVVAQHNPDPDFKPNTSPSTYECTCDRVGNGAAAALVPTGSGGVPVKTSSCIKFPQKFLDEIQHITKMMNFVPIDNTRVEPRLRVRFTENRREGSFVRTVSVATKKHARVIPYSSWG